MTYPDVNLNRIHRKLYDIRQFDFKNMINPFPIYEGLITHSVILWISAANNCHFSTSCCYFVEQFLNSVDIFIFLFILNTY